MEIVVQKLLTKKAMQVKNFLANVCVQWKDALNAAVETGIRVVKVRFGTVLSINGGALKKCS